MSENPIGFFVRVDIALATAPYAAAPTWLDISDQVEAITYRVARTGGYIGHVSPAEVSVRVENNDGRWNNASTYASAPYVGNVVPGRLIRIRTSLDNFGAWNSTMFVGFLVDVVDTSTNYVGTATLRAEDVMRVVERSTVENWTRPAELTGTRINALLTEIGLPNGGGLADFVGTIEAGTVMLAPATMSGSALQIMKDICRTEIGMLWVNRLGQVEFRNRYHIFDTTALNVSQATFDGNEIEFEEMTYTHGAFVTPRSVAASGTSGRTRLYGSIQQPANFPEDTTKALGQPHLYDGDVEAWAEAVQKLSETVPVNESRLSAVSLWIASQNGGGVPYVRGEMLSGNLWLFTAISVLWRPAGWTADHDYNCRIEGITHTVDARAGTWYARLELGPRFTRWRSDATNHFYQFGTAIVADHRGSI
jgi:hypothetical protein